MKKISIMKKAMRKTAVMMVAAAMAVMPVSAAFADDEVTIDEDDTPYLSLGADLTEEQEDTVLDIFGIDKSELSDYDVHYVTNDEEYKYLGDYVDSSRIGSVALSSVVIKDSDDDNIDISTHNISYCTEGMYRNALVTAGVSDVDAIVAGPYDISGTAALVGMIKAYENMTGEDISDDVIEGAVDEITTTGDVGESTGDTAGVEAIVATVKEQLSDDSSMTSEEIAQAIRDAADRADVDLSDEDVEKLVEMLENLKGMDIDWSNIQEQSQSILENFGDIFSDENKEEAMSFISSIINWIKGLLQ